MQSSYFLILRFSRSSRVAFKRFWRVTANSRNFKYIDSPNLIIDRSEDSIVNCFVAFGKGIFRKSKSI